MEPLPVQQKTRAQARVFFVAGPPQDKNAPLGGSKPKAQRGRALFAWRIVFPAEQGSVAVLMQEMSSLARMG
ncbi:hypothetical protein CBF45_06435 [Bordetella sp. J329]|nr:hypothetical protein CBF45_06435 [Bordetella sp. J329]